MTETTVKDYMLGRTRPREKGAIDGRVIDEVQQLAQAYKKHQSMALKTLLDTKRKKLAKKGIRIGM